jgi:glycosyltransferase involved in cell wall biosynthesis
MLSVLVPVYNYPAHTFIKSLHKQGLETNIEFEIIVIDNASNKEIIDENVENIKTLQFVRYIQHAQNLGRSRIRNRLADEANYEHLVFLDCDLALPDTHFFERYVNEIGHHPVVCGGLSYESTPPAEGLKMLRWKYGHLRESTPLEKRKAAPYESFKTSNFLIQKNYFNEIRFNENIVQYGHEDTLFGLELKKKSIPVLHINNPVLHLGIDDAPEFLEKSKQALANLVLLSAEIPELKEIKILNIYNTYFNAFTSFFFLLFVNIFSGVIKKNLNSAKPRIWLFDIYRLAFLAVYKRQISYKNKV